MLLVVLLATTAFAACSDNNDNGGGGLPISKLTVRPNSVNFNSAGGETVINAQSPVQAAAVSDADWCEVSVGQYCCILGSYFVFKTLT